MTEPAKAERYVGEELELFSRAENWKAYFGGLLRPYLVGDVLEVGAGLGATTRHLSDGSQRSWLCLEPDGAMARRLADAVARGELPACCRVRSGTIGDLPPEARFDAILYIDVLEHIEDDARELAAAARRLRPGGVLIVLAPAHGWLYSPFDRAIGHHRRYTRRSLARVAPPGLTRLVLRYLDSVGLLASAGNRFVLRKSLPTSRDIARWDTLMVPLSRRLDPWLGFRVGKSVLGVWRQAPVPRAPGPASEGCTAGR
jgi:SAM-dependent methyltransferase